MADQSGYNMPPGYPQQPMQGYGEAPPSQHGGPPGQGYGGAPPPQPGGPPGQVYPPYNYQPMTYFYYISSKINGLVLDIESGSETPMTNVVLWHKKDVLEADNQLWYNDYTTGTIKSKLSNLCLEFKDGRMVVNTYQPGNPNQLWEGASQAIKNRMNQNLVLEVQGGNREPGAALTASNYNGSPQQQFEPIFPPPPSGQDPNQPPMSYPGQQHPLQPSPSHLVQPSAPSVVPTSNPPFTKNLFYVVSEMNGKVMDIEGGNPKEGAAVIVYSKQNGAQNQLWYVDQEGLLRSALNEFVPCASGNATPLKMYPFTGGGSQRFKFDGKKIVNGVGECVDIRGAWKHNGTPLITYKYSGNSNQHWKQQYV